jgi:MYXO-CTERM domain-containing protein
VGQDWNELNGANEFSSGQAVCPGDSGGPLLSPGGAVMGVASRVSDCENASASAKYVRLDAHKALIDQAFAAAGATPSIETGTPTTTPKKPTGEGPCSTGAECSALLCSKGTNSFCTQFCGTGSCDPGTYCVDGSVLIGGQAVDEKICVGLPKNTACEACRSTECVNLVSTCMGKPECTALLACVDACTDEACVEGCIAANPSAEIDYGEVAFCACNSSCADECSHQCIEPPAGGGGSSGAGATGGGPSGGGTGNLGGAGAVGGTGGTGGSGAGPVTNPVSSGDSGGCNVAGTPSTPWWLLGLVLLGARRRRTAKSAR